MLNRLDGFMKQLVPDFGWGGFANAPVKSTTYTALRYFIQMSAVARFTLWESAITYDVTVKKYVSVKLALPSWVSFM